MTKEALKISIESEVLEKAKNRIPNISAFVETCLKQYLGIDNGLVPTSKMYELADTIGKCQLELYLMNEREHIEEAKEKAEKQAINIAWRKLYTTYRDTKTIDEHLLDNAVEVLGVCSDDLCDIVEVCYVFNRDDEVDVTEWQEVYEKYGEGNGD